MCIRDRAHNALARIAIARGRYYRAAGYLADGVAVDPDKRVLQANVDVVFGLAVRQAHISVFAACLVIVLWSLSPWPRWVVSVLSALTVAVALGWVWWRLRRAVPRHLPFCAVSPCGTPSGSFGLVSSLSLRSSWPRWQCSRRPAWRRLPMGSCDRCSSAADQLGARPGPQVTGPAPAPVALRRRVHQSVEPSTKLGDARHFCGRAAHLIR